MRALVLLEERADLGERSGRYAMSPVIRSVRRGAEARGEDLPVRRDARRGVEGIVVRRDVEDVREGGGGRRLAGFRPLPGNAAAEREEAREREPVRGRR